MWFMLIDAKKEIKLLQDNSVSGASLSLARRRRHFVRSLQIPLQKSAVTSFLPRGGRLGCSGWVPLPRPRNRGYQLRHPSEVLGDRCKRKLVLCAARTSQSKSPEPEDTLQVREPHLDALALATRLLEGIGASERSGDVTSALIDAARDPTLRCFWTASGFEIALYAVGHTAAIEDRVSGVEPH
jgi:hypothetical protein